MAKPTPSTTALLCIAAALFILLGVADARYDLPDLQAKEPTTTIDADANPILLLPSEKPGESSEPEEKTVEEVPTAVVGFRPINRHFAIPPIGRRLPLPHGGAHKCHHGHIVKGLRPWTPRYGGIRDLPYGNDNVIVTAGDKDSTGGDGDSASLPLRWRQPDYKYKSPVVIDLNSDLIFPGEEIEKPDDHHRQGDGEHKQEKLENLILNKIRKFLHRF